jgi:hypothetical protein
VRGPLVCQLGLSHLHLAGQPRRLALQQLPLRRRLQAVVALRDQGGLLIATLF